MSTKDILEVFSEKPTAIEYDGAFGATARQRARYGRWLYVGVVLECVIVAGQWPWDMGRRHLRRDFAICDVSTIIVHSLLTFSSFRNMVLVVMMMILMLLFVHLGTNKAARDHMRYVAFVTWTAANAPQHRPAFKKQCHQIGNN